MKNMNEMMSDAKAWYYNHAIRDVNTGLLGCIGMFTAVLGCGLLVISMPFWVFMTFWAITLFVWSYAVFVIEANQYVIRRDRRWRLKAEQERQSKNLNLSNTVEIRTVDRSV